MFLPSSWFRMNVPSHRSRSAARRGIRRREAAIGRIALECLEERVVLSTISWTNPSGGNWDTASNWSGGKVPTLQDDVVINNTGITITHSSSAADSVHSLTSRAAITLSAGSLQVDAPSSITGGLSLSGGSLTAKGNLTVQNLSLASGTLVDNATLDVGGFTWTGGKLGGSGQVDSSNIQLAASVPSLANATMALGTSSLSLAGDATIPLLGKVHVAGTVQDASHFSLAATIPSVKVAGFTLSNDTVTLNPGGVGLKGTAALPLIGTVPLTGTINSATNYGFSAKESSVTLGGFQFTNDTVSLANGVVDFSGTATLSVLGSINLSGTITDSTHYSVKTQVPSVRLGGFSFTNDTVSLTNGAVDLTGTVKLPVIGSATLTGTITDASHFSLTDPLGNLKLGPFTLSSTSVTVSDSGGTAVVSLDGITTFVAFGDVNLTGTLGTDGAFTLGAPLKSVSLLGGLVTFQSMAVTMTVSGSSVAVGIKGQGTVAKIGNVNFTGSITDPADYSLTGTASLNIAGFSIDTADFTLGTNALGVNFTLPVPEVGDVSFSGSYGPGGQWSLGATYPGPVEVGPVTLTDLGFTLSNQSLTLQATGSIADFQDLANVKITAQVFDDGEFLMTADAHVVQVGPFSLGQATITVGNAYPQHQFQIHVHAVAGFPSLGADITLDGFVINSHNYDLKGTDELDVAGLKLTSVQAELSNSKGFVFTGTWNYVVLTAAVSGSIQADGHVQFEGKVAAGTTLGGFTPSTFDVKVDLNPQQKTYSIDVSAQVNVVIATLNLQATSSMDSQGWQPLVLSAEAAVGGPVSSLLSGQALFTVDSTGVTVSGNLQLPAGIGSAQFSGDVNGSDGAFSLVGSGTLSPAGFSLTSTTVEVSNSGAQIWGSIDLPGLGSCNVYGSVDASGNFLLSGSDDLAPVGFSLTNTTVEVSNSGAQIWGSVYLPGLGSCNVYGSVDTSGNFSLLGYDDLAPAGFSLTSTTVEVSNSGAQIWGSIFLPDLGSCNVYGSVDASGNFSLSGSDNLTPFVGFTLTSTSVTVSNSGVWITGTMNLTGLGSVYLQGSVDTSGNFSLSANQDLSPGGFKLSNATVIVDNSGLSVNGTLYGPGGLWAQVSGSIYGDGSFSLTGDASASLGGDLAGGSASFTFTGDANGNVSLGIQIDAGFDIGLDGPGNPSLSGSISASLQTSDSSFNSFGWNVSTDLTASAFGISVSTGFNSLSVNSSGFSIGLGEISFGYFYTVNFGTINIDW